jgi:hypothetical protein
MLFGRWNLFVLECGGVPLKPKISDLARERSVSSRKGKIGGNNKGGRIVDKKGYVLIWMPEHPNSKIAGYVHEHRLVMSELLKRPLETHESVHHLNGNRSDNRKENLELWSKMQPAGQRVKDKLKYAKEIIKLYSNIYENPELL